ncbi:BatD family protein [Flagellimonas lutaonensis]|uniref:Aerotolerance-related exported protein n=1 Tax=Flagellimonas lutaonensis TaxID=516051 RepID=A0A0D5YSP1_9FLAO|nr:BatD family protein [Allomuricauda lutaonensis]AKA34871.1 Aerotolerance-related exported protein [Allomuricauda lutaonensis]
MRLCYLTYVLLFSLLAVPNLWAQDDEVSFQVNLSKEKLGVNERLRVEFTMNKDGDNFVPPDFEGFNVIMGPTQQISSSWFNGKRSFSKSYAYILTPTKQGVFTIKQASIEISGKTYKTVPKKVEVTAAVDNPNAPPSADDIASESLDLVAEISKGSPYLNEAVSVVYKLYISPNIRVTNYRPIDNPKYNNFWSQDIPVTKYNTVNTTYKGKPFRSVVLKRMVLYPQKTGKLEIEPLSLEIYVDVPTNRRDFFGGRIYKQTSKIVSAGKRVLNVKPLPEAGKPANFSGAVGEFDFTVSTSKSSLNASESLQAKIEISGKGNLKLFQLPDLELPSALEVYEPEFEEKVRTTTSGMEGKVANSYTIVPSYKGKYPIPSISFSYFNPKTEKYHILESEEITLDVLQGPTDTSTPVAASGGSPKYVVPTGKQFHFIKTSTTLTNIGQDIFLGSTRFYLFLISPLLLIPIAILVFKRREAIASDVEGNRLKRADRLAKKFLSKARKELGNKDNFYVALEKALHNYLKAKLKIETSEFSKEKITTLLAEKNVDDDTINGFIALLKNCEMARYSPFSDVQMQQDYDKASEVISKIDKQL